MKMKMKIKIKLQKLEKLFYLFYYSNKKELYIKCPEMLFPFYLSLFLM